MNNYLFSTKCGIVVGGPHGHGGLDRLAANGQRVAGGKREAGVQARCGGRERRGGRGAGAALGKARSKALAWWITPPPRHTSPS